MISPDDNLHASQPAALCSGLAALEAGDVEGAAAAARVVLAAGECYDARW